MNYPYSGVIPNIVLDRPSSDATTREIIKAVCKEFGISEYQINEHKRHHEIREPRQVAMYLIRKHQPDYPLMYIGRVVFNGYDHTTVIHSINKVAGLMKVYPEYAERINNIELTLATG